MGKPNRLDGRKNFDEWKVEAKAYLATKGHWKCFDGTEADQEKNFLAIQMLNLLLSPQLYTYTADCTNAKVAWDAICGAFEESGIGRRVDVLKQLVDLKQTDCQSMEEYVHKMSMLSAKIKKAGLEIGDEVIAALMLAGLPSEYRPMVMAMENSTAKLTTDYVKNRLLQEVSEETSNDAALVAGHKKVKRNSKRNKRCFICNKEGHFANQCPSKGKFENQKRKNDDQQMLLCSYMAQTSADDWYVDSGASAHMTMNDEALCNVRKPIKREITVGDNSKLEIKQVGEINISLGDTSAKINDVLHIPGICANLLSVSQMAKRGCTLVFNKNCCKIFNTKNILIASAPLVDDMYKLNLAVNKPKALLASHDLWHRRFGHPCDSNLEKVKSAVEGVDMQSGESKECDICIKGKLTRSSFKEEGSRASCVLEIVHSDVAFMPHKSMGGAKCFVTFIDDYSRKVFLYPMKQKNEVYDIFVRFKEFAENQMGTNIKALRTDNGREYCNNRLKTYLDKNGILHQLTVPYSPEQNGVAERMNRTIIEKVRCMLFDSNLNANFWAEAAVTASYLINLIPCRGHVDCTPEQLWTGHKPDVSKLRVFGCKAYAHIPKEKRDKLSPKATEAIMIGYSEQSKAYRLFDTKTKRVFTCKDAKFFENNTVSYKNVNNSKRLVSSRSNTRAVDNKNSEADNNNDSFGEEMEDSDNSDDSDSEAENVQCEPNINHCKDDHTNHTEDESISFESLGRSRSSSVCEVSMHSNIQTIVLSPDASNQLKLSSDLNMDTCNETLGSKDSSNVVKALLAAAEVDVDEPKNYHEFENSENRDRWQSAMDSELNSLTENQTWELCDLPADRKAIDSKWVYKIKRNSLGGVERYKARLVIKGYSQIKGVDYDETYSPVARYASIRLLIAMAVKHKMIIHQMDAVTAFLQGELSEEIYMHQPKGFDDGSGRVCRLKKALYGLKQASRVWNNKLNAVLLNTMKFSRSVHDRCIYFKHSPQNLLVIAVWVDDVMIFSTNSTMCTKLKRDLSNYFKMKDLGAVSSLLGVNIISNNDGSISMNQQAYLLSVLKRFNMENCKSVSTPLDPNQKLSQDMCAKSESEIHEMTKIPYQEAIGCIMYAAVVSRPDLCYAVNVLSRYNNNYGNAHWNSVKRVLRYIKGTINYNLTYRDDDSQITGYCDADWAGDLDHRRSTTGYVFRFQGGAISWATRRQPTVALSTTEAEFMAMSSATQEALWLKRLECEVFLDAPKIVMLYCDNQGAIVLARNKNYHARTKHIDLRKHFIEEHLLDMSNDDIKLSLVYMPTEQMMADILTKAVSSAKLTTHISAFGLSSS